MKFFVVFSHFFRAYSSWTYFFINETKLWVVCLHVSNEHVRLYDHPFIIIFECDLIHNNNNNNNNNKKTSFTLNFYPLYLLLEIEFVLFSIPPTYIEFLLNLKNAVLFADNKLTFVPFYYYCLVNGLVHLSPKKIVFIGYWLPKTFIGFDLLWVITWAMVNIFI